MSDDVSVEIRSVLTDVLDKGPEEIEASWAACAEAGLLGLAAPEGHGGEGLRLAGGGVPVRAPGPPPREAPAGGGFAPAEGGALVRGLGARAGDLPFRETLVCGLPTLARSG